MHANGFGGPLAEIETDAAHEGAAIVDDHANGLTGPRVRHRQAGAEWQRAMGRRHPMRVERLAAGGVPAYRIICGNDALAAVAISAASTGPRPIRDGQGGRGLGLWGDE